MENAVLKKRLNTFKTERGKLRKVSDDLLVDILRTWESWPGTSKDFYRDLGLSKMQFMVLMKKAKKLCQAGYHPENSEFKEIKLESGPSSLAVPCIGIELSWSEGKVIRFAQVEQLVEFLKKAA